VLSDQVLPFLQSDRFQRKRHLPSMSQMRLVAAGFYRKYNVQIVRRCGTTVREVPHLPPFLIRVGIISSSVGLATPLFATVGVARLWYNYLPKTANGQILKLVLGDEKLDVY
jgi:hypothetical protein